MKNYIAVPSKVILAMGLLIAAIFYFASGKYPTVSCLAGGDCYIPGATPLWVVATWVLIITIVLAGVIAFCYHKFRP
ncbi:MAG TPA: hypothetical protein VJ378_00570 [Candidatus Paceibacterota bacterium]|nr:hypothetical protein [Candidatus Paceibacterota bacterium]